MSEKHSSILSKVSREPMLHFLVAALCIAWLLGLRPQDERPIIRVDAAHVAELVATYESDPRVTKGTADVDELVAEYARDELLYQEALKYEIHRNQNLRGLLIREMRRQLEPVISEPTEEDLRNFLATNAARYKSQPSVAFEHVSWPPEVAKIPDDIQARLNSGVPQKNFGQRIRLANPIPLTYLPHLKTNMGVAAAEQIMASEPGVWSGPIQSKYGTHFIRILHKNSTGEKPFEQIRSTLKSHWISEQIDLKMEQILANIAEAYQLDVPDNYLSVLP
ncbi:peptidylprolyl isomerase [Coraliomargarita sp. SDUM461003]|uniref:Peptidylprolyl isomerase n=1 Tax=Thalassobacterium maritimum TaxID=3041265 RepID=A0ABU1APJ9_9BACT|nr:peptidylprolyl isomerase [Coraliomargarita sp. SDUM461003]MDQ8206031.1 peptidylprolyl isomerase [Coraliomargarita sp. SDUM461003]